MSQSSTTVGTQPSVGADLSESFQRALHLSSSLEMDEEPEHDLTQGELDALYSNDMNALSQLERERVYHDIHGVADDIVETEEFVKQKTESFQRALEKLVHSNSKKVVTCAYEQAVKSNPTFVQSLHVAFLRSELWNPTVAAVRFVGFWELKLSLFGPALLTREVYQSDLSKNDRKSLESGFFQLLPQRDVAGRVIMAGIPSLRQYNTIDNVRRAFFYMVMTTLTDKDTQTKGIVLVGVNMGSKRIVDRKAVWAIQTVRKYLPMRVAAMHYCYDDFKLIPMMSVAMLVMGTVGRVRFKTHYGNTKDVLYKLLTFGIPENVLPLTTEGEPKSKNHKQWIKSRRKQEESPKSVLGMVVVPGRMDTLLGRGKPIQEHFGNLRYHSLLDYYQEAYERAKKFDKMKIAERIVRCVHDYGGRFLKQEDAGWLVVNDSVARDKVSHAFRTRRSVSTGVDKAHDSAVSKRKVPASSSAALAHARHPQAVDGTASPQPINVASGLDIAVGEVMAVTDSENEGGALDDFDEDVLDISMESAGKKARL